MATEREELIAKAEEIGLEFKKNVSTAALQLVVDEAEAEAAEKAIEAKAAQAPVADTETSDKVAKEVKAESDKASGMRMSTEMVKVNITALDPRMREIPSEMFVHMGKFGTKKQVVKFGKDQLVYKVIANMLKEKKSLQQIKKTNIKGKEITTYQMSPAFMVIEVPLTEDEIAELESK